MRIEKIPYKESFLFLYAAYKNTVNIMNNMPTMRIGDLCILHFENDPDLLIHGHIIPTKITLPSGECWYDLIFTGTGPLGIIYSHIINSQTFNNLQFIRSSR